jgi:hypothetical protein
MTDTSASTPEAVREWASEWSDVYAQDWDEEKLSTYVGKRIKTHAEVNGEPKGFEGFIIGYSIDTIVITDGEMDEDVHRYSFLIDQGLQCSIFAGMTVEEVVEE